MTRRASPASGRQGWALRDEIVAQRPHTYGFDAATHTYTIDEAPVRSVTQYLTRAGLIDFSRIPSEILARAQFRGTWVHAALHLWQENDFDLDDAPDEYRGYVACGGNYLTELGSTPLVREGQIVGIEARFWDAARRFAGTMDRLAFDRDGVLAIDDWKTGIPSDVAAPLQLAAYEYGVRKYLVPMWCPDYQGPIRRRAVKLHADGRPATVEPYTDPRDIQIFFAAMAVVNFHENGMRHDHA